MDLERGRSEETSSSKTPGATPFRSAEKKYRLRREELLRGPAGRKRPTGKFRTVPVDLSDVYDFSEAVDPSGFRGGRGVGDAVRTELRPASPLPLSVPAAAFSLLRHPGLVVVPGALSQEQQWRLACEAVESLVDPPSLSNLTPLHGELPIGLWDACLRDCVLHQPGAGPRRWLSRGGLSGAPAEHDGAAPITARALFRKLRWATLGKQYDWTRREYRSGCPERPLPSWVREFADRLVRSVWPERERGLKGEAAILNLYWERDTLSGHRDDAERDLSLPIVSLSLGCPGIFLLGGEDPAEPPVAFLLRGGDAVILGGAARKCTHGMARVLLPGDPALPASGGGQECGSVAGGRARDGGGTPGGVWGPKRGGRTAAGWKGETLRELFPAPASADDDVGGRAAEEQAAATSAADAAETALARLLQMVRINLSIRDLG